MANFIRKINYYKFQSFFQKTFNFKPYDTYSNTIN